MPHGPFTGAVVSLLPAPGEASRLIVPGAEPVGMELHQRQPGWAVPVGLCLLPTNL